MLQLQQVWTHGKRMPIKEERMRDKEMFQVQQRRTYSQGLQKEAVNAKTKNSRRIRG